MGPEEQQAGQDHRQHEGGLYPPINIHFQQEPGIAEYASHHGCPDQGQDDGFKQMDTSPESQSPQAAPGSVFPPDPHHPVHAQHREDHRSPKGHALTGQEPQGAGKKTGSHQHPENARGFDIMLFREYPQKQEIQAPGGGQGEGHGNVPQPAGLVYLVNIRRPRGKALAGHIPGHPVHIVQVGLEQGLVVPGSQEGLDVVHPDVPFLIRQGPAAEGIEHLHFPLFRIGDYIGPGHLVVGQSGQFGHPFQFYELELGDPFHHTHGNVPLEQVFGHQRQVLVVPQHLFAAADNQAHFGPAVIQPAEEGVDLFLFAGGGCGIPFTVVGGTDGHHEAVLRHILELIGGRPQVHFPDAPFVPGNGVLADDGIPVEPEDQGRGIQFHDPFFPEPEPDVLFCFLQGPFTGPGGNVQGIHHKVRIVHNGLPFRTELLDPGQFQELGPGEHVHGPFLGQFVQAGVEHCQGGHPPVPELLEHLLLGNSFLLGHAHQAVVFHDRFDGFVGPFHLDPLPVQAQGSGQSQAHQGQEQFLIGFHGVRPPLSVSGCGDRLPQTGPDPRPSPPGCCRFPLPSDGPSPWCRAGTHRTGSGCPIRWPGNPRRFR